IAGLTVGVGPAFGQVSPSAYTATIASGGSAMVEKTVVTPAIPPKVDILFLADTTGSMTSAINNVKTNAASILNSVRGAQPDSQFGAGQYRDFDCSDPFAYQLTQAITANLTDAQNGINAWSIGNGCDTPEAQLDALFTIATDPATAFRRGSTRIVVWFGDATGHDPSAGHTIIPNPPGGDVIPALKAAGITVIAIPVNAGGDGLDNTGQATAIANATGGQVLPTTNPNDVANAILAGLQNLPV